MQGPRYEKDERGYLHISKKCEECEFSYIEDIWWEWCCKKNECPFEEDEDDEQRLYSGEE